MVNKIQLVLIFVCYWSLAHSLETTWQIEAQTGSAGDIFTIETA